MKWYSELYVGSSIEGSKHKIIHKIKQNKLVFDVYLIALPEKENRLLEIIPVRFAKAYPQLRVVGIAKGKQEALELVAQMIDELYRATGDFDVTTYLKNKSRMRSIKELYVEE